MQFFTQKIVGNNSDVSRQWRNLDVTADKHYQLLHYILLLFSSFHDAVTAVSGFLWRDLRLWVRGYTRYEGP